jgi:hypothetical protein
LFALEKESGQFNQFLFSVRPKNPKNKGYFQFTFRKGLRVFDPRGIGGTRLRYLVQVAESAVGYLSF